MQAQRKPDTTEAMRDLIQEVREVFPFEMPAAQLCSGPCRGCPKKLLEFIDEELTDWATSLDAGDVPSLGELQALGKRCRKIHAALASNGLVGDGLTGKVSR